MRKAPLVIALAATLGATAVSAPAPAEARNLFPAIAGGLVAGAVIGGLASSAYGYGPGYGYYGGYGPAYYGGYAPAYYGGYGPGYGYATTYYDDAYVPAYTYRRVVRPAFAYYPGPRYYRRHHWHHW